MKNVVLFAWVLTISAIIGSIHSWHFVEFKATPTKKYIRSVAQNIKGVGVLHFLTPTCSCSETIFNHLVKRGPLSNKTASEKIILIDDLDKKMETTLSKAGFSVINLEMKAAREIFTDSIIGVPLLLIFNDNKKVVYSGGYSEKLITPFTQIDIKKFLNDLDKGREIASLPVKGCAVSKEIQNIIDPLGLKYNKDKS